MNIREILESRPRRYSPPPSNFWAYLLIGLAVVMEFAAAVITVLAFMR